VGAIAAAQDRVFHADLYLANLRQRHALSRIADQGKAFDFCRVKTDIPRRAAMTSTERISSRTEVTGTPESRN
jgi:hypothetical protein